MESRVIYDAHPWYYLVVGPTEIYEVKYSPTTDTWFEFMFKLTDVASYDLDRIEEMKL